MASPSSLSQENGVLHHPYQRNDLPGPKGAYEIRQVPGGLYVRVDMPGVPPEAIKLYKYSDTSTVTFMGKAPKVWDNLDSSERVYGGYVVLDQDPCQLVSQLQWSHKNGCLRLFFPGADGTLHSLSKKQPPTSTAKDVDHNLNPNDHLVFPDARDIFCHVHDKELIDMNTKIKEHSLKEGFPYRGPSPEQAKAFYGGNYAHINPFLLSGEEGVLGQRKVSEDGRGSFIYMRIDMPGVGSGQHFVQVLDGGKKYGYLGEGGKEYSHDEGGRRYTSLFFLKCHCCIYKRVKEELEDGVLRMLICECKVL